MGTTIWIGCQRVFVRLLGSAHCNDMSSCPIGWGKTPVSRWRFTAKSAAVQKKNSLLWPAFTAAAVLSCLLSANTLAAAEKTRKDRKNTRLNSSHLGNSYA